MSEDTQTAKLKVTLKGDGGFEAPWVSAQADTEKELSELLADLTEGDTLERVATVAVIFNGVYLDKVKPAAKKSSAKDDDDDDDERPARRSSSRSSSSRNSSSRRSSRDDDDAEEHPDGEECKHGVLIRKTGRNKDTDKKWAGWFCPKANRSCDPIWDN